jgi:hypothetical protein
MQQLRGVIAARRETLNLGKPAEVRTDFPVNQAGTSAKWYEEYPTHTDPVTGKSAEVSTDIYSYDPATDKRGAPIDKNSAEYKTAHDALWVLRDKYTPKAIVMLPLCSVDWSLGHEREPLERNLRK